MVDDGREQVLAGWTLPDVEVAVVDEAAYFVVVAAPVRTASQPLHAERGHHEQDRIARPEQHFRMDLPRG
jgi:hypothetical protein